MIRKQVYERPTMTVLRVEEDCGLLAGSDKNVTVDKVTVIPGTTDGNPDEIDAKKNNICGTGGLWND